MSNKPGGTSPGMPGRRSHAEELNARPAPAAGGPVQDRKRRMTTHVNIKLPPLGYAYDALEPATSGSSELHYAGHHRAYVDGVNRALEGLAEMRGKGDYALINQFQRDLAFQYSGHLLHSLFWRNLEPNEGKPPSGPLESRIKAAFGSTDAFRRQFGAAGAALQGSGWVALAWEITRETLVIQQIHDHQNNLAVERCRCW